MKLDIYVDVTEVEDWLVVANQVGTLFRVSPEPWRPALGIDKDHVSKDVKKHFLVFALNGDLVLTDEQEEFLRRTDTKYVFLKSMELR